ncbi:hypothetical protein ACO0LF_29670 [Undibacterium sp. Di27W]|uniref:hypothetical protein n=1 Tax=Undibacterium sp. Di27W TaxID=3413036 RepID=UPI003BEF62B5
MSKFELDWAAPIIPGKSMLGLYLGMTYVDVLDILRSYEVVDDKNGSCFLIKIKNAPTLLVDQVNDGIILRDAFSKMSNSTTFDKLFVIGFRDGVLTHLMTSLIYGASLDYYNGVIWGEIGFGSRIADIGKFCEIEFDPGDELFYSVDKNFSGFSIGGSSSSLDEDPEQRVSYIRVYAS